MERNELKKPAALQFRHNRGDGFIAGYEKEEMDTYLSKVYQVIVDLKSDYDEVRGLLQNTTLIKDEQKEKADKVLACLKSLVTHDLIKDCPEKKSAIEIVKKYTLW